MSELLTQLEAKVAKSIEVIDLLRMQIDELEDENRSIKAEQERWRKNLNSILNQFDRVDLGVKETQATSISMEEEFTTI